MLNVIIYILAMPFVPLIMFSGSFNHELTLDNFPWFQDGVKEEEVLGASRTLGSNDESGGNLKIDNDDPQRCNLFPLDITSSGYIPQMKKGSRDILLWAGSSVAIDVDSGTILHYDNGRKRTQIASLTKMMTAVLVVENIKDLDNDVTTLEARGLNITGTVVGCPTSIFCNGNRMVKGEQVKTKDLLKAMLLNSANDAATSLGIRVAGSPEKFVDMMNAKAKELGLQDTHFCTPSGLEIDGREKECYSSAYDIGRIAVYSLKYNLIWDIMKIQEGKFYSVDGKLSHDLKNTDILLGNVPNCLGGKTGFTPMAGKSLMMGAVDSTGKHRVISVILNDENRWEDMTTLVNWVFNSYDWR